jgi:primosomal protein N' (replication factor Y)
MIPTAIWKGKLDEPQKIYYKIIDPEVEVRGTKQKEIIEILNSSDEISVLDISASKATLNSLIKKKAIEEIKKPTYKKPDYKKFPLKSLIHRLTNEQVKALKEIQTSDKPILLHGITGSGKTELYLRVILDVVKKGKQAILLVPEIALTPQMIDYFKDYFGPHLALFHSKLSDGQRAEEWWKVKSGYAPVLIGSRSAIFAPVQNLGVVILDEEHEWTYKQESAPYYQTHHVGEMMSDLWGSQLILGSATPRVESIYKVNKKEYKYLQLSERINKKELPRIQVIDLRDEFKQKNFSVLSRALQNKIKERLEKREQIILFVNQRGVARAVTCRDCGYTEECPNCEVSLKLHRGFGSKNDALICHYCSYAKSPNLTCPECKSPHIKHVGVGTQRVEEEVGRLFPDARIVRADKDTTSNKEGFEPIYKAFKEHKHDILIGTQMVAKGLDFNNVTLIGIILADIGLHIPDFRSHERLFQLITQVSGRCGRGKSDGKVILQTYQPNHFAIKQAARYEYDDFVKNELSYRDKLSYPPYNRLIKFTIVGNDLEKLRQHIEIEEQILEDIFKISNLKFKIVSAPAMIPKIANRYYYHILIRANNPHIIFDHWKPPKYWRIDVDPIHTT